MRFYVTVGLQFIFLNLFLAQPAHAAKPWQTLEDCQLAESWRNDGDSFKVHWNGGELTVRLYFADTPEADYRFRDRTKAQADYFGISEEQAVEVGKMAKQFTKEVLKDGFSVRTRWQGVFSGQTNSRKYGIVSVGEQDLAEMLVANGLARIHGMGIGGQTWEEVERLKGLEAKAKAEGRGAWGLFNGRAVDSRQGQGNGLLSASDGETPLTLSLYSPTIKVVGDGTANLEHMHQIR